MARTLFRPEQEWEPHLLGHFHDGVMEALRHLRLALGTGAIFYGFDVREDGASGLLQIAPGLAFDGSGRSVALDSPLPLPPPNEAGPLWLCLRFHGLVDERDVAGRPLRERDSVEVAWLGAPPRDDDTIPLARLQRGPRGWLIDGSVARRAPPLAHRHTGETVPDRSDRLRFDGAAVRGAGAAPGGDETRQALQRLEGAVAAEFAKLHTLLDGVDEQQRLQGLEIEELRAEVAESAERQPARPAEGWPDALAALREELTLTAGEELRAEIETLRAELNTLAARPASMGGDLGAYTPIEALHGIGKAFARQLRAAGIGTVHDLLRAAATPEGRERLEATGQSLDKLRRWHHEADLLRLHGVGPGEVALLTSAAIHSTADLPTADPRALYERLRAAAAERPDVAAPALAWVQSWIEQARQLPPVVAW